jgi:hypothetical protein
VSLTVKVYPEISRRIRSFGLRREVLIQLITSIHEDIPREYPKFQPFRTGADGRYRKLIEDGEILHLFKFWIDDSTAQGFLIVADVWHSTYEE